MLKRTHLLFLFILSLSALLAFFKIPLASSQGLTLVAPQVPGDLPLSDPDSPLWQRATALEVPLSAQNVAKPVLLESKVRSITARLLHNQSQVAILLEWEDQTRDESTVRVQDFRDSVAVQFPLIEGQPFFCMGQQGGNVNIWHWKADWQADILARQDMETAYADMYVDQYPFAEPPSGKFASAADYQDRNYLPALAAGNLLASEIRSTPVEDLVAGGFGSLTTQLPEFQNVQGFGAWADGRWRVILSRDLSSQEVDDISFSPGKSYSISFAVWDGSNGERNGQKSTSQWVSLQLEGPPSASAVAAPEAEADAAWLTKERTRWLLIGAFVFVVLAGAFIYWRLPE